MSRMLHGGRGVGTHFNWVHVALEAAAGSVESAVVTLLIEDEC